MQHLISCVSQSCILPLGISCIFTKVWDTKVRILQPFCSLTLQPESLDLLLLICLLIGVLCARVATPGVRKRLPGLCGLGLKQPAKAYSLRAVSAKGSTR